MASDFDQTLSFNDSGYVLSEMLGISDFPKKVAGLSRSNLVKGLNSPASYGMTPTLIASNPTEA